MEPGRRTRPPGSRIAASLVVGAVGAFALSACSGAGSSLAQQACVHVDASIRLFTQAEHATDAAVAQSKATKAAAELAKAEPIAARANSTDPAYNPLMTTLQEASRTSEANLIPALRAQCSAARNPTAQQTPVGAGTPSTSDSGGPSTLPTQGTG